MQSQAADWPSRLGGGLEAAVRARDFRWFLAGMVVFGLVQTMNRFLLPWLAYETTRSSTILGLIGLALAAPTLVLLPIGGVWADRTGRLRIIAGRKAAGFCSSRSSRSASRSARRVSH